MLKAISKLLFICLYTSIFLSYGVNAQFGQSRSGGGESSATKCSPVFFQEKPFGRIYTQGLKMTGGLGSTQQLDPETCLERYNFARDTVSLTEEVVKEMIIFKRREIEGRELTSLDYILGFLSRYRGIAFLLLMPFIAYYFHHKKTHLDE